MIHIALTLDRGGGPVEAALAPDCLYPELRKLTLHQDGPGGGTASAILYGLRLADIEAIGRCCLGHVLALTSSLVQPTYATKEP